MNLRALPVIAYLLLYFGLQVCWSPAGEARDPDLEISQMVKSIQGTENSVVVDWSCADGGCYIFSALWKVALQKRGEKFLRQYSQFEFLQLLGTEGNLRAYESTLPHYYLSRAIENGADELVIDPTYLQFFENLKGITNLPSIFVGRRTQLFALFEKHSQTLRRKFWEYSKLRNIPVAEVISNIYGFGDASYREIDNEDCQEILRKAVSRRALPLRLAAYFE